MPLRTLLKPAASLCLNEMFTNFWGFFGVTPIRASFLLQTSLVMNVPVRGRNDGVIFDPFFINPSFFVSQERFNWFHISLSMLTWHVSPKSANEILGKREQVILWNLSKRDNLLNLSPGIAMKCYRKANAVCHTLYSTRQAFCIVVFLFDLSW